LKVVQINCVLDIGSTGFLVNKINESLLEVGHLSYIAYGRANDSKINTINTIKIGDKFSIYNHVLQTRIFDKHGYSSKKSTVRLLEELDKISPDVIHLHNIHGYYLNLKLLFDYIKKKSLKVVWTLHDCWAFTGHCAYYDLVSCDKWKTECFECANKNVYPASLLFDNSTQNFRDKKSFFTGVKNLQLVTPSNWLAKEVKQSFLNEYDITVIPNGIAFDNAVSKPEQNISNKVILGVANIWDERKGFNDFIKLAKLVSSDINIVMVGLSDKQLKLLPDNIKGYPKVYDRSFLMNIYQQASVFFNPTREETFGLVNVEALLCGVPVVTYNSGGSPETINESCGKVVPKGDLDAAYEAINEVFDLGIDRQSCIDFAKNFSLESMTNKYISLYERLL
jgi:putative colanic acid biosynthesis glycosyltransferase